MNYCIERPRRPTGIRSAEHPLERAVPQRWTVAFAAAVGLIFSVGPIVQFSFGVFIKPVGDSLHADRAGVSSALLVALCLSGLMTPILGRLVDRFGPHRVALPAVALFALAVTLIGVASVSLFWFVLCYGLTGVFSAAQTPLVYGTVITSAFDSRRGLALGIAMAGVGVGTVMVPRLAQYLVTTLGWREAYVALGALTLVTVIPALLGLLRGRPIRTAATAPARARGAFQSRVALRPLLFWKLAAAFMATAAACSGVTAHVVPMMTDRHVSSETASMAISSAGIALILGRLGAGFLLDCLFAPYVAVAFFLLPLAGIVVVLTNVSVSAAIGAASLVGMGLGAEVDLIAYLQSRYLGLGYFAETYGYFLAVFMVGSGIGPFVMGVAYSHTGNYVAALVLLAAGLIAASAVMLTLGPYKYRLRTDNLVSNEY